MTIDIPEVEVLLPVHNEAESIERVIMEIYHELSPKMAVQFIVCEDGSRDGTKEILARLEKKLPMKLMMSDQRKGYSRAVIDGMKMLSAPYLLSLDSDGQCDPGDFWAFWEKREAANVILGRRVLRADSFWRRVFSSGFYYLYQLFYNVPVHDPSCPFMLARREIVEKLAPEMGEMQQGFWWEFVARAHRRGFTFVELPIKHRLRFAGQTQVYRFQKLPGIGYKHFMALFKILRQTRGNPVAGNPHADSTRK